MSINFTSTYRFVLLTSVSIISFVIIVFDSNFVGSSRTENLLSLWAVHERSPANCPPLCSSVEHQILFVCLLVWWSYMSRFVLNLVSIFFLDWRRVIHIVEEIEIEWDHLWATVCFFLGWGSKLLGAIFVTFNWVLVYRCRAIYFVSLIFFVAHRGVDIMGLW